MEKDPEKKQPVKRTDEEVKQIIEQMEARTSLKVDEEEECVLLQKIRERTDLDATQFLDEIVQMYERRTNRAQKSYVVHNLKLLHEPREIPWTLIALFLLLLPTFMYMLYDVYCKQLQFAHNQFMQKL